MKIFLTLLVALLPTLASAQFVISSGGPGLTYHRMATELAKECKSPDFDLRVAPSSGSIDNLDRLLGNQVNSAIVQSDVLFFRAQSEDLNSIKTLLSLHPEEVHFLAPAVARSKEGGTLGFGAKPPVFTSVAQLAGRKVGAVGGSAITARVIRLQGEVNYEVVVFDDTKSLVEALDKGMVDAAVIVGGAPVDLIAGLDNRWKLLPFTEGLISKLSRVYRSARLSYTKMGATGVPTVAIDALLVSREYKTAKMQNSLATFRACAMKAIPELQETTGTHAKWQAVNIDSRGKWPYYELPAAKK